MLTKLPPDIRRQVDSGISILKRGGIVAFPTDTVYGLGACASLHQAVEQVVCHGRPTLGALDGVLYGVPQALDPEEGRSLELVVKNDLAKYI